MPTTMLLDELASWFTIVQSVFVVISLIFIWLQLRQSTELAKAANAQSLVEHSSSFNTMLIQDKEIARLWYSYGKDLEKLSDVQPYRELMIQWLIFHEKVYYQYEKGLLDKRIIGTWHIKSLEKILKPMPILPQSRNSQNCRSKYHDD